MTAATNQMVATKILIVFLATLCCFALMRQWTTQALSRVIAMMLQMQDIPLTTDTTPYTCFEEM